MPRRAVHVTISGRVQGVGYRAWTERLARTFGLEGWARNRRNGDVEAMFVGDEDRIAAMLAACHQGPATALVATVAVEDRDPDEAMDGFQIRPTA